MRRGDNGRLWRCKIMVSFTGLCCAGSALCYIIPVPSFLPIRVSMSLIREPFREIVLRRYFEGFDICKLCSAINEDSRRSVGIWCELVRHFSLADAG